MDKNFCGGYLAVVSEIAFYLFYYEKRKGARTVYLIAFGILFAGAFYSGSRAAVLISLAGVFMVVGENILLDLKKRKILLRVLAFFVCLCIFIVIALPELRRYFLTSEKLQWYWNRYFVLKNYVDYSNNSRLTFWRNGIELWKKRIIFGYGPGLVSVTSDSSAVAHNTYIDYMVDMGIVGLFAFLLVLRRSWKGIFRHYGQSFKALPVSVILLSIILSMPRSVLLWYMLIISWLMSCAMNTEDRGQMK
ncbi:MAG: O-antigen ligase family protein [Roseburia sp.]|nr:O-antigen ligase family protein [Roseburia sp.]